ncbi:MAG: hypothetical protein CMG37_04110 [Candidatus Marinimicrobia bacterium]|nr:hypothetical protein [Candidatus Neomarinimicrobiota bacterium]MBS00583.1 hypothetical protein [Candidatus Neomarinimicrobiota bacterium]MEC7935885.1 DUF1232 domain-containing protein [Candidatus Neomarinimicrobiota bacterium]MEC9027380.1 DUF1232 domain-containing protein [Candidatus Neomarinimicrobiota bacterium]MEC9106399.1 DUF1232 domain-containing protein [Candidatus Neomarinimicrobiota bacterium]|tara:strand:+ start:81 stop:467 length:387 start_codon:yes stop_codon:yes gene_type:complete
METPNQIQLTEKDKERYRKEIEAIDINIENSVMQLIPEKLEVLINLPQLDDAQLQLVNDVAKLYQFISAYPIQSKELKQKILFALQYFVDPDDDIPDSIPNLGFIDDAAVVRWIVDDIIDDNIDIIKA